MGIAGPIMHFQDQARRIVIGASRLAMLSGMLLFGAGPLSAEPLITGAATYELQLDPGNSAAAAADIFGEMTLSLERECSAYRTEAVMDIGLSTPDGKTVPMTMRSILIETGDTLDFDLSGEFGRSSIEEAKGTAKRTEAGLDVSVTAPADKAFAVAGPVLFPIAMVEAALAAAKAGRTFADYRVFDGSGHGEEVWSLSVFIAPVSPSEDLGEEALFASGLGFEALDRWRMKFSYFEPDAGGEQVPAFTTEAIVYANGFALATVYDLGGVALRVKLIDFAPLPPTACE
ncbi:MAG: DUF1849 family protein [Bauldia sp.]|nr:MAG: DUF1849 family protein [Bauldia sp.]